MKKIKIMLTSVALVAVVGGALAFKAKYSEAYCTAPSVNNACLDVACPNFIANQTTVGGSGAFVCTTTAPASGVCGQIDCTTDSPKQLRGDQ